MPKKHREKRRKYVQYLLKVEKERDAYLEKRMNRKRLRGNEEEEVEDASRSAPTTVPVKRHRHEQEGEEKLPVPPSVGKSVPVSDTQGKGSVNTLSAQHEKETSSPAPRVKTLRRRY